MSELIRKSHNVSVLMYHIVCPAKYRQVVFTPEDQIRRYVQEQGQEENYEEIHSQQLALF